MSGWRDVKFEMRVPLISIDYFVSWLDLCLQARTDYSTGLQEAMFPLVSLGTRRITRVFCC
jgi:hypothetical protein